ncbi:MAG: carboxypeptidase M32 [Nitrospinae bacterium]|nr:carboxypeptidase M32 [Nitrospinota bacterium]
MHETYRECYQSLVEKLEEKARLAGVMSIMHWDQEVTMPKGAWESRAKQMAALAGVIHEKSTAPEMGEWITKLMSSSKDVFSEFEWRNITEARRAYDMETKVPKSLVQELAELTSRAHEIWVNAREKNRFKDFAPSLKRLVKLRRQWAHCVDPHKSPYDVNIDESERGATVARLDPIFEKLKSDLIPLIKAIKESLYQPNTSFLKGDFAIDRQRKLAKRISRDMGFSFEHGRMDVSVHPFCGGGHPTDVRITTRYRTDNFVESLFGAIHEAGHGLYEQGRMQTGRDLPVSEPLTMGIHESQSLFWERMIAQSRSFCSHYLGLFAKTFPESMKVVSPEKFYEAVNVSHPSFIRVEADEVTYPMHVILRYEIEKGLFDDSIPVDRLPEIWNDKIEQYLGIRPPTDTLGVLQDVHWSGGSFGYFPSYTLGAIYACQFYNALKKEIPDAEDQVAQGHFLNIKDWLNRNIHSKGRLYETDELVLRVTGGPLDPELFVDYLKEKYRAIYRLN